MKGAVSLRAAVQMAHHARAQCMNRVSVGRVLSGPMLETRVSAAGGPFRARLPTAPLNLRRALSGREVKWPESREEPEIKEIAGVKFQVRGLACAIASCLVGGLQGLGMQYAECTLMQHSNNKMLSEGAAPGRRTPCAWAPVPSGVPGPRSRGCSPLLGDCYGMQGGAQCAWCVFMCSVVYMVHCKIAVVHAHTPTTQPWSRQVDRLFTVWASNRLPLCRRSLQRARVLQSCWG
jgi:hypothetical protein